MKQTAVEWYAEQMQSKEQFTQEEFNNITNQAKYMENNKYSEEDMKFAYEQGARLALISQSSLALQKGEFPTPKEWFEQFKNE
jgi:hypothetical protein